MDALAINKPANECSEEELQALLAQKSNAKNAEKLAKRKAYESLRDETVTAMVEKANAFKDILKAFKATSWAELETLYKMLQEHSSRHTDGKGSFTLETSDKLFKVQYKRQDNTRFDERADQAEAHILDFLTAQFGDDSPTSKLVRRLMERRKGKLDKDRVLQLLSMRNDFDNEHWRKGIELLEESIVPAETKYYAQFSIRNDEAAEWQNIVLDFAKL